MFGKSPAEQDLESRSIVNTHIIFSYYPFIKLGWISKIDPHDVNFLEAQGCFRVPTRPILDEFIREYFLHVHPILPMINEKIFWKMYENNDSNSRGVSHMSLLVFHAMLFASSSVSVGYQPSFQERTDRNKVRDFGLRSDTRFCSQSKRKSFLLQKSKGKFSRSRTFLSLT